MYTNGVSHMLYPQPRTAMTLYYWASTMGAW